MTDTRSYEDVSTEPSEAQGRPSDLVKDNLPDAVGGELERRACAWLWRHDAGNQTRQNRVVAAVDGNVLDRARLQLRVQPVVRVRRALVVPAVSRGKPARVRRRSGRAPRVAHPRGAYACARAIP